MHMMAILDLIFLTKGDVEITPEVLAEGEDLFLARRKKQLDDLTVQDVERKMINRVPPTRWSDGTRVITIYPDPNSDFTAEAKAEQRWGCAGNIVRHSDSHGLCYAVRLDHHPGESWYLPTELRLETPMINNGFST